VPATTPTQHFRDIGIAFGNGVGLVSVGNSLLRSTDGLNWTEVKRFSNGLFVNSIAYNGGDFLLGRTDFSQRFVLESSTDDGQTFSIIPNVHANRINFIQNLTQVKGIAPWKTGFAVAGTNGFVLGTEDLTLGEPGFQRLTDADLFHYNYYPFQLAANGSTLARLFWLFPGSGSSLSTSVQTSTDGGFTWSTPVTDFVDLSSQPELLALGGKYFIMTTTGVNVSDDAITWIEAQSTDPNPEQSDADLWAYAMTFDGTRWVAVIEENVNPGFSKFFTTSTDGINWTKTGAFPTTSMVANEQLLFIDGEYFFICRDFSDTFVYRSTDLTNWSLLVPPVSGTQSDLVRIDKNGNRWLLRGLGANKVSDDGLIFYDVPNLPLMPTGDVIEFNGKFYASRGNNTMLVSNDLHFWSLTDTTTSLQNFLTGNANGLLLVDGFSPPKYVNPLPEPLPAVSAPPAPAIPLVAGAGGTFTLRIPTEINKFYYIQTNPKLNLPLWGYDFTKYPSMFGDGTVKEVEITPVGPSGFFRVEIF
jgi:hypothetical protein